MIWLLHWGWRSQEVYRLLIYRDQLLCHKQFIHTIYRSNSLTFLRSFLSFSKSVVNFFVPLSFISYLSVSVAPIFDLQYMNNMIHQKKKEQNSLYDFILSLDNIFPDMDQSEGRGKKTHHKGVVSFNSTTNILLSPYLSVWPIGRILTFSDTFQILEKVLDWLSMAHG